MIEQTITHAVSRKPKFRTKFLIYPRFQLLLIGFNFGIVTLGFGSVLLGLQHFFGQLRDQGVASGLKLDHYYYIFLREQAGHLYQVVGAAYLLSIVICTLFTIYLSQKISGPILRVLSYFQQIARGAPSQRLEFRKGDFFPELPEAINKALRKPASRR